MRRRDTWPADRSGGRRGFTLMEVMVTICIIGVLAALLLPIISVVRNRARLATAQQTLRLLTQCLESYRSADAGGHRYPPPQSDQCLSIRPPAASSSAVLELLQDARLEAPRITDSESLGQLLDPWGEPYRYVLTRPVVSDPTSLSRWNWDEAKGHERAWGKRWDATAGAITVGALPFPYVYSLGPKLQETVAEHWVFVEDVR